MRLIVMGQQAFGKEVLATLLEAGIDEVAAVYCEPDQQGRPLDPLKELAIEKGIPVHQPKSFRDEETLATMAALDADLMIMAFVTVFLPEAARNTPRLGSICFHPSLLPRHRGPSAVNWPIIMGATRSGYSWFYPNDGLDEGDSLLQWECSIDPDDTVIDLYFKKIFPSAVASVLDVCELFRAGNPPRIVPDEKDATYERRCEKHHAKIDWNKPVGDVYNLIRGTNPSPGAWTTFRGEEISIFDCECKSGDGLPRTIHQISDDGVSIQSNGGIILVKRVKIGANPKIYAREWAEKSGILVGEMIDE